MNSSFIAVKGQDALFLFNTGVTYIATTTKPVYVEYNSNIYKTTVNTGPNVIPPSSPWILLGGVPASGVTSITANGGLSGGTITSTGSIGINSVISAGSRTLANISFDKYGRITGATNGSAVTSITAGSGLSGGTITTTGTISLPDTGVSANTYTLATITVDQKGRITSASNGTAGGAVSSIQTTAGITGGTITTTGTIGLADSGVLAASYSFPTITVDRSGRIISASSNSIPSGTVTQVQTINGISGGTITTTGSVGLTSTGVNAGSYTSANITIDKFGRITTASNGSGSATLPGGANTYVQYNEAGGFSGTTAFTYNKISKLVSINLLNLISTPTSGSTTDQILTRDTSTGNIRRISSNLLKTTPGGANGQFQYNDSNTFNGDSQFYFSKTEKAITLGVRSVGTIGTNSVSIGQSNINSTLNSITVGTSNNVSGNQGSHMVFGISNVVSNSIAANNTNFVMGVSNNVTGSSFNSGAFGSVINIGTSNSIAIGSFINITGNRGIGIGNGDALNTKKIVVGGQSAIVVSTNTSAQVVGHGALAPYSSIFGGVDGNIANSTNDRAVIVGGNGIKLTSGYSDFVAIPNLAIFTNPTAGGTDDVLTWNATSKKVGKVTQASISDRRLKTNFIELKDVVSKINTLSTYEYENNGIVKELGNNKNYGLIAQEVEKIFPHVVKDNFDYNNNLYKTVDYRYLIPVLFAAVKELSDEINKLKK